MRRCPRTGYGDFSFEATLLAEGPGQARADPPADPPADSRRTPDGHPTDTLPSPLPWCQGEALNAAYFGAGTLGQPFAEYEWGMQGSTDQARGLR